MGSYRQGESIYNTMSIILEEEMQDEQKIVDETTITVKAKKVASQHSNRQKDFIERNKQSVQAMPKSTLTKRPKEDSSSLKQAIQNNRQKKNYVPTSTTHSIYSRSHSSPEITLREEIKKLKRLLLERDDWLREKESELMEAEDIVEALQERVRQVEARNRELQKENEIMRHYIKEENQKKISPANELTKIINSMMNGESTSLERVRKFEGHLQKENEFTNIYGGRE